ncbi:fungal specific transcription factor domain-containing protein [Aspergillus stella-maris]|uniref:fungal specific transcription factor domain-containing protein n=1 Tax=Aspergillus stella-maris TaxID=1810926 RepID=UPI003CCD5699
MEGVGTSSDNPRAESSTNPSTLMMRAIGCNRQYPCSHCQQKNINCTYAEVKVKEKRTRIHFTPFYERKIDHIDRRLDGIIELLHDLRVSQRDTERSSLLSSTQTPSNVSHPTPAVPIHAPEADSTAGPLVEGDSSLTAHSAFANEFLESFLSTDSVQDCSLELRQTLDALAHTVATLKKQSASGKITDTHLPPTPRLCLHDMELPPIEKAVVLIPLAKSQSLAGTGWIYEFIQLNQFSDMCLGVYFSDSYPEADFITVNAGLHSLFWDYAFQLPEENRTEYFGYARLCGMNFETALADLPLHLPATPSTILALTFGAFHFVELSKPSLSWTFLSKASELCQTLGYHLSSSMKLDSAETVQYKLFLFWGVYFLDKSLSLRLGRASTILDSEITVPRPAVTNGSAPVMAYFPLWIESARCQGNIYAMLYSPSSVSKPDKVRRERVQILLNDLQALERATQETHDRWIETARQTTGEDLVNFFAVSDDVHRLTLLTLVHRAAPPEPAPSSKDSPAPPRPRLTTKCINAAQTALQRHHDCMAVIRRNPPIYFCKYIHWTLLFAPFSPFIVIFCHIIETQDAALLRHLHSFVESIQSAPHVSDAAARMYRLFLVLYNVAMRYLEFRTSRQPEEEAARAEMDSHLAALGLGLGLAAPGDGSRCVPSQEPRQELHNSVNTEGGHALLGHGYRHLERHPGEDEELEPVMRMGMGHGEAELDPDSGSPLDLDLGGWVSANRAIMGLVQESDLHFLDEGWIN